MGNKEKINYNVLKTDWAKLSEKSEINLMC